MDYRKFCILIVYLNILTKNDPIVLQVKFLTNKPGASMVQMSDKIASEMIIRNLSGSVIFDSKINIM